MGYACSKSGCPRIAREGTPGWLIAECTHTYHSGRNHYTPGDIIIRCPEHATRWMRYLAGETDYPPRNWSKTRQIKRIIAGRNGKTKTP